MGIDLQKASLWKRASAWLFDTILLGVLAVAMAFLISGLVGYDDYSQAVDDGYAAYEAEYGVTFDISQEEYLALSEDQRLAYDQAYEALIADEAVLYNYNMVLNLSLLIITLGILAAVLVWELAIPLGLKNGQTLGKKIFGLSVMRVDGVMLPPVQLFIRSILGKYTVEIMIPVYLIQMFLLGRLDLLGLVLLAALLLAQMISLIVTRTNSALHDLLAGTVVVDHSSQRIFRSTEDLIEYTKRAHAQEAARQSYF